MKGRNKILSWIKGAGNGGVGVVVLGVDDGRLAAASFTYSAASRLFCGSATATAGKAVL